MSVKRYAWNREKNQRLKAERNISFEEVVIHIANTVIPSRKATAQYLRGGKADDSTTGN